MDRRPIKAESIDVKETLGNGQYGTVFRVIHKETGTMMAMKVPLFPRFRAFRLQRFLKQKPIEPQKIEFTFEATALSQLQMEINVLNKSNSPYIVKFYGSYLKDTFVHYCMEFMDYGSLEKLYAGGVPEPILAKISIAMIQGLHYMKNALNVIHRGGSFFVFPSFPSFRF